MTYLEIPSNFLDIIHIGRSTEEGAKVHFDYGNITDVNIWNRALTLDEMLGWTNCRYNFKESITLFRVNNHSSPHTISGSVNAK